MKTSIIIVTYNGLYENTIPCLNSVFEKTDGEFEVVVVDNNSVDGTVDYLHSIAQEEPRLKVIVNKENLGFAGGNNIGVKRSVGSTVVLLNSDTIVTQGWLRKLNKALEDKEVGLVGPISNSVGNEQMIYTAGNSTEAIIESGIEYTNYCEENIFETDRLGFFCVAMKRKILSEVGLLDENFGLGFFEDDDFCIRVKQAGYKLVCYESAFVYHKGGGSFNKLKGKTKALMARNKKLLEDKHSFKYKVRRMRELQLGVVSEYIHSIKNTNKTTGALYCARNRIVLIDKFIERNGLKYFFIRLKLEKMKKWIGEFENAQTTFN